MPDKMHLTDAEWRAKLTPEQYQILRERGTERAFTGKYEKNKAAGEYVCAGLRRSRCSRATTSSTAARAGRASPRPPRAARSTSTAT